MTMSRWVLAVVVSSSSSGRLPHLEVFGACFHRDSAER